MLGLHPLPLVGALISLVFLVQLVVRRLRLPKPEQAPWSDKVWLGGLSMAAGSEAIFLGLIIPVLPILPLLGLAAFVIGIKVRFSNWSI